jgi:uncharacterized membrane protein YeaQ/YmgE (transglycosylase-associated protein family)
MSIIWTIIIGFIAGIIAKFIMPGDNEPSGFILTTILGILGAFVAKYLGHAIGWYQSGEGAGLIGAIIVLVIWGLISGRRRPSTWITGILVVDLRECPPAIRGARLRKCASFFSLLPSAEERPMNRGFPSMAALLP